MTINVSSAAHIEDVFSLSVDYEKSIVEAVEDGRYDRVNKDIVSANFPARQGGLNEVKLGIVHFGYRIRVIGGMTRVGPQGAIDRIEDAVCQLGAISAEIRELLALGQQYPDLQRRFPVAALGSCLKAVSGSICVPFLYTNEGFLPQEQRILGLHRVFLDWWKEWRFAVIINKD